MKITEVQVRRRSLYQLYLDGQEGPQVDRRTFDESPYGVDSYLDADQLEKLLETSRYNRLRDRALYLLGLRDYACKELEKKLTADRETPPELAAAVVNRLAELGLLDDEQYASRAALSMRQYKQYPRRRIEQELCRRGVEPAVARAAAEEVEGEDFQQALALIEKKYYNKLDTEDSRRRVIAALARRGFSYGAIRQAMTLATEGKNDDEEFDTWQ